MGKETLSISDAREEDALYFRSLRTKEKPLNKVFTEVLNAHRNLSGAPVNVSPAAVSSSELENLTQEIETLNNQIAALKQINENQQTEISILKEQNQTQKIQLPSFIYTPSPDQFTQMRRYFALLRKKGLITTTTENLPQTLTNKAITYLFKNEFPEVIK